MSFVARRKKEEIMFCFLCDENEAGQEIGIGPDPYTRYVQVCEPCSDEEDVVDNVFDKIERCL